MENSDIENLYIMHGKMIFRYLLNLTNNNTLIAEELTQETFYQALLSIKRYRGDCKVTTWLCQIANHVFYNYHKKEKKYNYNYELINNCNYEFNPIEYIIQKDQKCEFYRALQKIPKEMREVVYLKITGEFTFLEIGQILKKSETWARTNFYRGKQKLIKEVHNNEN